MEIVELILEKESRIAELRDLTEELMNENQGLRDIIKRQNDYINNYQVAINRFNDANKD